MRSHLIAKYQIEAWLIRQRRAARRRIDPHGPERVQVRDANVTQKELNAVIETVVEVDFGDGDVKCDLRLRPVELIERPFDDAVSLRIGIDHDGIVRNIRQDADPWQKRAPAASAATATASSETGALAARSLPIAGRPGRARR